jgi:hypothetical protein
MLIIRRVGCVAGVCLITGAFAQPGPLDCWHLDEGAGTVAGDGCGSYSGTLMGGATWAGSLQGNAVNLNGVNQYVLLADANIIGKRSAFTVEAWVNWKGGPDAVQSVVYCEGGEYGDNINLHLYGGVPGLVTYTSGRWHTVYAPNAISTNEWHHLAGVLRPGVGGIIYLDGAAAATNADVGPATDDGYDTTLGSYSGTRCFYGAIDELRVYGSALTAGEVWNRYRSYYSTRLQLYAGLTVTGLPGEGFSIEASINLADTNAWMILTNITLVSTNLLFIDTASPNQGQKFYRAIPVP